MKKFLNKALSVLISILISILTSILTLFTIFIGVIYAFTLSLVKFVLCLPIIIVSFLFLKTKNK